jgi:hypothetical protein
MCPAVLMAVLRCRSATFLSCLQSGALLSWRGNSVDSQLSVTVDPINQPSCVSADQSPLSLTGGFASKPPLHLRRLKVPASAMHYFVPFVPCTIARLVVGCTAAVHT